ncbi:hypothetical protein ACWV27_16015 [Massilia varians]
MRRQFHSLALALVLGVSSLSGCVQMPTEKQTVVDQRPQISFRLAHEGQAGARVFLDRLDVGMAGDYAEGKATLRVLPGTHLVEVRMGSQVLLNERVYLADGVSRSFGLN